MAAQINGESKKQIALYSSVGERIGSLYQMLNDLYDECQADVDERGKKNKWTFNLTFLKAIAFNYCDINVKKKLTYFFKKSNLAINEYTDARVLFKTQKNIDIANSILEREIEELDKFLDQIKNKNVKSFFSNIAKEMRFSKYHNHYEFESAGY